MSGLTDRLTMLEAKDLYRKLKLILKIKVSCSKVIGWIGFQRICKYHSDADMCEYGCSRYDCKRSRCPLWKRLNDI